MRDSSQVGLHSRQLTDGRQRMHRKSCCSPGQARRLCLTPTTQPLGLAAGRHHIELRASGYRTMAFDVDIVAGQVIPYRGALQP